MALGLLAGIGLLGSAIGALTQYNAGQAQATALREQADLDKERSEEFLLRTERNIIARQKQVSKTVGGQKVALAQSGVDIGTGVSLDIMEDTYMALAEEESLIREEAEFQADAIKAGADVRVSQADDVSKAGTIGGVTTLLGGVAKAFG